MTCQLTVNETPRLALHYEVWGSAENVVVLVHSMKTHSAIWYQQIPFLVELGYRVVALDLRGFGRSVSASDNEQASSRQTTSDLFHPRHFASDVISVLDELNVAVSSASVICLALGGWAGLPAVLQHPTRFKCLVLACSPGGLVSNAIRAELDACDKVEGDFAAPHDPYRGGCGQSSTFASHLEDLELAPGFAVKDPARAMLFRTIARGNPYSSTPPVDYAAALRECCVSPEAARACVTPVLVVTGDGDRAWSVAALHAVASGIGPSPGAAIANLTGVGHTAPFEDPEQFNAAVGDFLAKHHPLMVTEVVTTEANAATSLYAHVDAATEEMARLVRHSTVQVVSTGHEFTEGPVWVRHEDRPGGFLLFSDIPNHKIHAWTDTEEEGSADGCATDTAASTAGPSGGTYSNMQLFDNKATGNTSVWRSATNFGNGSCVDHLGRILTCEHGSRRVSVSTCTPASERSSTSPSARISTRTLCGTDANGNALTSPNDVAVRRKDRTVWFTDPDYGVDKCEGHGDKQVTAVNGVYVCRHAGGDPLSTQAEEPRLVVGDLCRPNGLCFSPDDRFLYVADSGRVGPGGVIDPTKPSCVWRFPVLEDADGGLPGCGPGVVVVMVPDEGRRPDGLEVDAGGRLFVCTDLGVEVFGAPPSTEKDEDHHDDGTTALLPRLGIVRTPQPATNCVFGGPSNTDLFFTAGATVWRVRLLSPGRAAVDAGPSRETKQQKSKASWLEDPAAPAVVAGLDDLTRQLVAFMYTNNIDREQLTATTEWLAAVGRANEWEDWFDVLGFTHAADGVSHRVHQQRLGATAGVPATPATLAGPYYRPGAPIRPDGALCGTTEPGRTLIVKGVVCGLDEAGGTTPLTGATMEWWGANHAGLYDFEVAGGALWNLRGTVVAGINGEYAITTRRPGNYSLPTTGPTAEFLRWTNRTFVRAAHLHVVVKCDGYHTLTTQVYFKDDPFAYMDSVRAVQEELMADPTSGGTAKFDFVLPRKNKQIN